MGDTFAKFDLVRHRASYEKAIITRMHYRCVKRDQCCGLCVFCKDTIESDWQPDGSYEISLGFGKTAENVRGELLEKVEDTSGPGPALGIKGPEFDTVEAMGGSE